MSRARMFRTAQEAELSYEGGAVTLHDIAEFRPAADARVVTSSLRSAASSTTTASSGALAEAIGDA